MSPIPAREILIANWLGVLNLTIVAILFFSILWAASIRTPREILRRRLVAALWTIAAPIISIVLMLIDQFIVLPNTLTPAPVRYFYYFLFLYSFTYFTLCCGANLRAKVNPNFDKPDHVFLRFPALPLSLAFIIILYIYGATNLIRLDPDNPGLLITPFFLAVLIIGWFIHPYREKLPQPLSSSVPTASSDPISNSPNAALDLEQMAKDLGQSSQDSNNQVTLTEQPAASSGIVTSAINLPAVLSPDPATSAAVMPPSRGMALKLKRSQKQSTFGAVIYILDARMEVSSDVAAHIRKHRLGGRLVYESEARQKHRQNAVGHLAGSADAASGVPLIATPKQVGKGLLKTAWKLGRSGVSAARAAMALRITIDSLIAGVHVECKTMEELLEAQDAIKQAAENLRSYVEVGKTFDGGEEVVEL